MKFLHSGDWHLGKTFCSTSLKEDQMDFFSQLFDIFENAKKENKPFDALLIPGDIYDKASPSIEAVTLCDYFFNEMNKRFPEIHIFVISGNHDGPEKLGFASKFLEKSNIHIKTDTSDIEKPVIINDVAIYQIPFLMAGSFDDVKTSEQQALYEKATQLIKDYHEKNHKDLASVICAHATVYGSQNQNGTYAVGTAESIDKELFYPFTYTALGHIHKFDELKENQIYYSGSPIAYTFDDKYQKVLLSVTIENSKIESIEKIPVKTLHPMIQFEGLFEDILKREDYKDFENHYVSVRYTDEFAPLNPKRKLKQKFPLLRNCTKAKTAIKKAKNQNQKSEQIVFQNDIDRLKVFLNEVNSKSATKRSDAEIAKEIELFTKLFKESENEGEK